MVISTPAAIQAALPPAMSAQPPGTRQACLTLRNRAARSEARIAADLAWRCGRSPAVCDAPERGIWVRYGRGSRCWRRFPAPVSGVRCRRARPGRRGWPGLASCQGGAAPAAGNPWPVR